MFDYNTQREENEQFLATAKVGDKVAVSVSYAYNWGASVKSFEISDITAITPKRTKFTLANGEVYERSELKKLLPATDERVQRQKEFKVNLATYRAFARILDRKLDLGDFDKLTPEKIVEVTECVNKLSQIFGIEKK